MTSSSSLGWLTESAILPKKPNEIQDVGKASMVDLRAAVYQSEEAVRQADGGVAAAALAEERRRRERRADVLGAGVNRGVAQRSAGDVVTEEDEAQRVSQALQKKAALYEAMMRGDAAGVDGSHALVDFELKQLTAQQPTASAEAADAVSSDGRTLVSADMQREAERVEWEASAHQQRGTGGPTQQYERRSSAHEKRLREEVSNETKSARAQVSDQRQKRQRALEERRAVLRLKQARQRYCAAQP